MAEFEKKEKYEGIWQGVNIAFNRVQFGRRLTDAECEALCRDEDVELRGLVAKSGSTYGIMGHLARKEYNGHPYIGVDRVGWLERDPSEKRGVPAKLCGHVFTAEEKAALESGQKVHVDGMVGKFGKPFSADLTYDRNTDKIDFGFGH